MPVRLSEVRTKSEYEALQPDPDAWLPAGITIAERHRLPVDQLRRLGQGTNVVFTAGDGTIVKLYPPFERRFVDADVAVARLLEGRIGVETPRIMAHDELEGWPYLVMTRLQGVELREIWPSLSRSDRLRLAREIGLLVARIHALPVAGLAGLEGDWPGEVERRLAGAVERHRAQGMPEPWLRQLPAFLARAQPLYPPDWKPAIVSGDIHDYHLMVAQRDGTWHISGLFDFDDSRIGFAEYDLAATALFLLNRDAALLHTFLDAYGYPRKSRDERLQRRLMAYTLLHRYRMWSWWRQAIVDDRTSTTFDQLAQVVYAL